MATSYYVGTLDGDAPYNYASPLPATEGQHRGCFYPLDHSQREGNGGPGRLGSYRFCSRPIPFEEEAI